MHRLGKSTACICVGVCIRLCLCAACAPSQSKHLGLLYYVFILITNGKQTFHFSKMCQSGAWRARRVSGPRVSPLSIVASYPPWIDPAAGRLRLDLPETISGCTRAHHLECSGSTVPHWLAIQKLYSDSDILGNCLTKLQQDLTSNRFSRAWTRDYLLKTVRKARTWFGWWKRAFLVLHECRAGLRAL